MMGFKVFFSVLSVVIGLIGFWPYLKSVFSGQTKPHAFTWFIWGITQGTATAALWVGGGGYGALPLTVGTGLAFLVFFLSLQDGKSFITLSDSLVLAIALVAIGFWWFLEYAMLSVVLVSAIDVLGYVPTFRKSYFSPKTEHAMAWGLFALSNVFSLMALSAYNILTMTYIVALFFANAALFVFLVIRRRSVVKSPKYI